MTGANPLAGSLVAIQRAMEQQVPLGRQAAATAEAAFNAGMAAAYADFSKPVRLPDGTLGYPVRAPRSDDCMAAALATCLQVPIDEVPDPRLDERLEAGEPVDEINESASQELLNWLADRGLERVLHSTMPVAQKRWIGIVPMPGTFNNHCLVMAGNDLLFDPVDPRQSGEMNGRRLRAFGADDVRYGFSFAPSRPTSAKD
jgi:hypothetical protein